MRIDEMSETEQRDPAVRGEDGFVDQNGRLLRWADGGVLTKPTPFLIGEHRGVESLPGTKI